MSVIYFNPQFRKTLELMEETNRNVFIAGRAGTGKSTLLNYFKEHTGKKAVVLVRLKILRHDPQTGECPHQEIYYVPITEEKGKRVIRDLVVENV